MAPKHPDWKDKQPYKAVLEGDMNALRAAGEKGLLQLLAATHAGMTTDEFSAAVADWCDSARHPRFKRPYTDLVYQPMLELMDYLRSHGFKTFIVSGGGSNSSACSPSVSTASRRSKWSAAWVCRSSTCAMGPVLVKQPDVDFVDDGPGKPVGIGRFIGRRPILAFGNSDGDQKMPEWTAAGDGARFMGIVHHTDAEREWSYDRKSKIGTLDKAWDEATAKGWTVVDMKQDWKAIYPFEQ